MEHFHMLTLQSKVTAHDYYSSLAKLTDHTGTGATYVCDLLLSSVHDLEC